jgi:hypothetical protein
MAPSPKKHVPIIFENEVNTESVRCNGARGWVTLVSISVLMAQVGTIIFTMVNTDGRKISFSVAEFDNPSGRLFQSTDVNFFSIDPIYLVKIVTFIGMLYVLVMMVAIMSNDSRILNIDIQTFHVIFKILMNMAFAVAIPPLALSTDLFLNITILLFALAAGTTAVVEVVNESKEWNRRQGVGDHGFTLYVWWNPKKNDTWFMRMRKATMFKFVSLSMAFINTMWVFVLLVRLMMAYNDLPGLSLWPFVFLVIPFTYNYCYFFLLSVYQDEFISSAVLEIAYQTVLYGFHVLALEWLVYIYYTRTDVWLAVTA